MTDQPADPAPMTATPPTASRFGLRGGLLLLLVVALVAASALLWRQMQITTSTVATQDQLLRRLSLQLRQLEGNTDVLQRHLDDTGSNGRKTSATLDQLAAQQQTTAKAIEDVALALNFGRTRFQLAAAEELLLLAHDRATLGGDAATVIRALELADTRLATISDSRLLPVRQALSSERLALRQLPAVDVNGAALALASLLASADDLPLNIRVPPNEELTGRTLDDAPMPATAEWPTRLWHGLGTALKAVFQIRREAEPINRLLNPQQQALVKLLLRTELESAHLALLRGSAAGWRESLDRALLWLGQHYQSEDARVLAARAELERLKAQPVEVALPVPQKALELLRGVQDSR